MNDFGHRPIVPPLVLPHAPALDPVDLARLANAYLPDISDAVGQLYTLDAAIRPIYQPMRRLIGQALTVKAPPGDNLTVHGALTHVRPNDVLVIDWRGTDACATGAGSLALPIEAGLSGAVVDGGWRDVEELRALDFPVFSRSISPFSPPKQRPGEINVPVSCGGVVIHPGDIIVGDTEGLCVVPLAHARRVAHSLREYAAHASASEWDRAELERAREDRAARWEQSLRDHGWDPTVRSPDVDP